MSGSRFLRGTLLLTSATLISKILGFIYVVPFTILVGTQGYILYEYAYKPYTIMLSVATMGVPLAVSKFISKYNALGDYQTGRRLFRSGLVFMTLTGIVAWLCLFLSAPHIASLLTDEQATGGNSLQEIVFVIRMVSFALLIVPVMSLMRGYFQGFESMGPTAVSQVVEQIVRIAFILIGSLIVLKVLGGTVSAAVGLATFAAFIGALGGLAVLLLYWSRRRHALNARLRESIERGPRIPLVSMYKELIAYAVPFVIVGLAIPLYQTTDTYMINSALTSIGYTHVEAEGVNSAVNLAQKLILIPVSLATAFSISLIPVITKSYASKDYLTLHRQITLTFKVLLFVTVPAAIGLSLLAYPAYITLFGLNNNHELGGFVLQWYAPTAILFALFSVTAVMLQGINRQRAVVVGLIGGLLIKLSLNYSFIQHFQELGAVLTTNIGYLFSIGFNCWVLHRFVYYRYRKLLRPLIRIAVSVTAMVLLVWGTRHLLHSFTSDVFNLYGQSVVQLLLCSVMGVLSYAWIGGRLGLLREALGHRVKRKKRVEERDTSV